MKFIILNVMLWSFIQAREAPVTQPLKVQQILSFDNLMHKVLLNSTQVSEIKLRTKQKQADAIAVKTLDNPNLQIEKATNIAQSNNTWSVEIEQPLKWSQFGAAQNYAQLLESTSNLEEKSQLLALRHIVLRNYINCWLQQEKYFLIKEQLKLIKQQQKTIQQGEEQGKITREEVKILEIDLMRMQQRLVAIKLEMSSAKRQLLQMAGLQQQNFIATKIALQNLPSLEELTQDLSQDAGVKSLLYKQVELAQSRYISAKKDAGLPSISPRAVYEKAEDTNNSTFLIGVSIPLPIWNRNQAELLRAKSQVELAETTFKQVKAGSWDTALNYHYQQAKEWRESSNVYEETILKNWQSIRDLVAEKFNNGQLSITDLANQQQQEVDLKIEYLETYIKAIESSIALETLIGKAL